MCQVSKSQLGWVQYCWMSCASRCFASCGRFLSMSVVVPDVPGVFSLAIFAMVLFISSYVGVVPRLSSIVRWGRLLISSSSISF